MTTCNDYLWLLASSEMVPKNSDNTRYGVALTSEGSQYKYYQGVTETHNNPSENRAKTTSVGNENWYWIRSPYGDNTDTFCTFDYDGSSDYNGASRNGGVAPGFCI